MAVVYKARQIALDRMVAVKVLPKRLSANTEFVDRFEKEGKAAARLNHPNIVQAIDVGSSPADIHYFVMEFVEGVTVFDELREERPTQEAEAIGSCPGRPGTGARPRTRASSTATSSPRTSWCRRRTAKLADMGLAREADDIESPNRRRAEPYGTPYYIAPEQIRGEVDIDFRADIYSLGATLYHMVTGRVPFDGATPTEVMRKHLKEKLVPPDHIIRHLSTGVGEVIEVMMAKKRDDRYETTKELIQISRPSRRAIRRCRSQALRPRRSAGARGSGSRRAGRRQPACVQPQLAARRVRPEAGDDEEPDVDAGGARRRAGPLARVQPRPHAARVQELISAQAHGLQPMGFERPPRRLNSPDMLAYFDTFSGASGNMILGRLWTPASRWTASVPRWRSSPSPATSCPPPRCTARAWPAPSAT